MDTWSRYWESILGVDPGSRYRESIQGVNTGVDAWIHCFDGGSQAASS
ncbi:2064_t:CDS:1, partial [Acaulospora colombiana]